MGAPRTTRASHRARRTGPARAQGGRCRCANCHYCRKSGGGGQNGGRRAGGVRPWKESLLRGRTPSDRRGRGHASLALERQGEVLELDLLVAVAGVGEELLEQVADEGGIDAVVVVLAVAAVADQ